METKNNEKDIIVLDYKSYATKKELNLKQDILVSGENIKTVNGNTILGNGNLSINGDGITQGVNKEYVDEKVSPIDDMIGKTNTELSRVNIKNIDSVLTQSMVDKPNTIYVIQNDFNLNSGRISFKENCQIIFNNGSIKNGTVRFNNTKITGNAKFNNVTIEGTIENTNIMLEWFRNDTNIYNFDYFMSILKATKNNKFHNIYIGDTHFKIETSTPTNGYSDISFIGNGMTSIVEVDENISSQENHHVLWFENSKNISFKGIHFTAPNLVGTGDPSQDVKVASQILCLKKCSYVIINNCLFDKMNVISAIHAEECDNLVIDTNRFEDYDSGILMHDNSYDNNTIPSENAKECRIIVSNNYFGGTYKFSEPITFKTPLIVNLHITNNYISRKEGAGGISLKLLNSKSRCIVSNNIIDGCGDGVIVEKSRCPIYITSNKFVNNITCHVKMYDESKIFLSNNYFFNDKGSSYVSLAQTSNFIGDLVFTNNIFDGNGCFKTEKCTLINNNNTYLNCTGNEFIETMGNLVFSNNIWNPKANTTLDKASMKIDFRNDLVKKNVTIRDNSFKINIVNLNDESLNNGSFIDTDRNVIIWRGTKENYDKLVSENKINNNTLYFVEE